MRFRPDAPTALTSVREAVAQFTTGAASAVDLAQQSLTAARRGRALNAFTVIDEEVVLKAATHADRARSVTAAAPALAGVPFAVKDIVDIAGMPVSAGTGALRRSVVDADAPALARLRGSGAQLIGQTNLHELSFGITSNNAEFGPVHNPHRAGYIAGGSSGGSAAAVAAGIVPFAVAGDTGGSSRIPAALCGVVGFRPSASRYPSDGVVPISTTRDTLGVIANSVLDVTLVDAVLSGRTWRPPNHPNRLDGVRIGRPSGLERDGMDLAVGKAYASAVDLLADAGADIVDIDIQYLFDLTADIGMVIVMHEFPDALAAYLAASHPEVSLADVGDKIASPDVRSVWDIAMSHPIDQASYDEAMASRRRAQAEYATLFVRENLSAIAFPTTPVTARPIGHDATIQIDGSEIPTFGAYTRYMHLASVLGTPGLSLPVGRDEDGLPIGLELDGISGADDALFEVATSAEHAFAMP